MQRLGISIYSDKADKQEIMDYIDRAAKYGFTRIFSCLLSVEDTREHIIAKFKDINDHAHAKGMEVIVDVAPRVFPPLGVSYQDLSFFQEISADGLRLDVGYTGNEESLMTFNPQGLKIEINMSHLTHYIDTIMDYQPNKYQLLGCHNFYPHRYCGLDLEFFMQCTENFNKHGLRTAAFVTSQVENSFGPWPVGEGLPTLEMHRDLPIELQLKHFIAMGNIDDVIISNCYASEAEMQKMSDMRHDMLSLSIELHDKLPEVERKIILEEMHFNRGDKNPGAIRSTQSRVKFKGHDFAVFNPKPMIEVGDVVIESSLYGHYAGELQIALIPMKNTGKSNVVGRIPKNEHFLLDYIKPWQKFSFTECEAK